MSVDDFEPWRIRLAAAFADVPDLKITKFSEELGKNRDYVRRLIQDGTANPTPSLLVEICDKLGVSSGYILSGDEGALIRDKLVGQIHSFDIETLRSVERIFDALTDRDKE